MPKIDFDVTEHKKPKKKKPWASIDELLSHGKNETEKGQIRESLPKSAETETESNDTSTVNTKSIEEKPIAPPAEESSSTSSMKTAQSKAELVAKILPSSPTEIQIETLTLPSLANSPIVTTVEDTNSIAAEMPEGSYLNSGQTIAPSDFKPNVLPKDDLINGEMKSEITTSNDDFLNLFEEIYTDDPLNAANDLDLSSYIENASNIRPQLDNENNLSLNVQKSALLGKQHSSIESQAGLKNKTSIQNVDRIYKDSIDNLYRNDSYSIQNLYRPSIENHRNDSQKKPVYTESINKSIYKSIQTESAESSIDNTPNFQNLNLSNILKVGSKQFVILLYLFKTTTETGTHSTKEISANELAQLAKTSIGSARSAVNELIEKKLVSRKIFSKAGWTVYEFSDSSYNLVLKYTQNITDPNLYRFYTEMTIQNYIDLAPSKLVSNNNTNLLTKTNSVPAPIPSVPETTEIIDQIDISAISLDALSKTAITRKQIQDIKNQKLNFTTSTLQDFIDRFAVYISDPKNVRNINNLPGVFVKMAQMTSKGEDPLADIETDADRLIRERIEALKAKKEQRGKQRAELMELEFENWLEEIQQEGRDRIAPPSGMLKSGSIAQKMTLKNYFIENIWPEQALDFSL